MFTLLITICENVLFHTVQQHTQHQQKQASHCDHQSTCFYDLVPLLILKEAAVFVSKKNSQACFSEKVLRKEAGYDMLIVKEM